MTERLYLDDPYVVEFDAEVIEERETDDGPAVVFAETYFYPESGGQPCDLGTIHDIPVVKVAELPDETILHFVERFPSERKVHCRIDAERRRDHMQQHSGQHILSAAFLREASAATTSFHLGSSISTIDLDVSPLSPEEVLASERAANDVVRRGVPIRTEYAEGAAAARGLRKAAPPSVGSLRIVDVEGFDRQACCGTHPRSSSEVGPIVVRGFGRFKGGTRVEFLCGERALRDYRATVGRVRALATVLSSSESDLVMTATRLQEDRKAMGKELERMSTELLLATAEGWMAEAELMQDVAVLLKVLEALPPAQLRSAATALTGRERRIVLLGSTHEQAAHLVFARSEDVNAHMAELLGASLEAVEGRGGGSARIAQGGGPRTSGLSAALAEAKARLEG
ncbi:MAG TPA: DHHA1 domain-containing protein [Vicinamibacteria bacterium]|nr:DHHA1 domain-containing protein [Vicinamibacteria bacterium]